MLIFSTTAVPCCFLYFPDRPAKLTKSLDAAAYNALMGTIYIDSLFLLNFVIDYLLCLISARLCGLILRRRRYLAAALVGALYAVALYLPGLEFLQLWSMKLCLWLIIGLIAFGREERMLRCALVFAAVSAAFGGFIWAIELMGGYPAFDMRTMLLAFALCYTLLRFVFRDRARLSEARRVKIRLALGGREAEFMALVDTGNSLCDPVSGRAVLLASPHALAPLFEGQEMLLELAAVELLEQAQATEGLGGKFRLIPYSSVGGRGLLAAFRPDSASADGRTLEIMAAVSKAASGDGFEAII